MERLVEAKAEELKMNQSQIVHTGKMTALGEMAGSIAHEINNPLTVIQNLSSKIEILSSKNIQDAKAYNQTAKKISQTVQRVSKIIQGLRTFSGEGELEPMGRVDISSVIQQALDLCAQKIESRGVRIIVHEPKEPAYVYCRSIQITQVLVNLLSNALYAVDNLEDKWIRISVEELESTITVSVTDSGSGIPEELQAKIMSPFFTTKPVGKGTGIGLSISKGIIESHNGNLKLDTTAKNTRFEFALSKSHPDFSPEA